MSKNNMAGQRANRQHPPTKIIVERHYADTEKMETVFKQMAGKLITEKRFPMLSARSDSGQEELTARIKEFEKSAIADKEQRSSIAMPRYARRRKCSLTYKNALNRTENCEI